MEKTSDNLERNLKLEIPMSLVGLIWRFRFFVWKNPSKTQCVILVTCKEFLWWECYYIIGYSKN